MSYLPFSFGRHASGEERFRWRAVLNPLMSYDLVSPSDFLVFAFLRGIY